MWRLCGHQNHYAEAVSCIQVATEVVSPSFEQHVRAPWDNDLHGIRMNGKTNFGHKMLLNVPMPIILYASTGICVQTPFQPSSIA